jgi:hypothetical protein
MRVLLLALCLAAGAVLVPAGALACDSPGMVHQSNRQTQVTVVDNRGAQSAGLISGPIVVPVQVGVLGNLNDVLNGLDIL